MIWLYFHVLTCVRFQIHGEGVYSFANGTNISGNFTYSQPNGAFTALVSKEDKTILQVRRFLFRFSPRYSYVLRFSSSGPDHDQRDAPRWIYAYQRAAHGALLHCPLSRL